MIFSVCSRLLLGNFGRPIFKYVWNTYQHIRIKKNKPHQNCYRKINWNIFNPLSPLILFTTKIALVYSFTRYGMQNSNARKAWSILSRNVYNSSIRNYHGRVLVIREPSLKLKDMRYINKELFVDPQTFWENLSNSNTIYILFDHVEIVAAVLAVTDSFSRLACQC